jgi:glucokinase
VRSLGIDLGGTGIKAAVLEIAEPPTILTHLSTLTHPEDGPEAVLGRMTALAQEAIAATGPVEVAGLGAPGPLDLEGGRSLGMPNLPGWRDVPLVSAMEARLGLPVALLNDARAHTLAELALGAGRGCANLVCFVLGTGVGGGVVVDGQLLLGLNGTVGELGHQTIEPDGPPCPCGNRGCLEQYASGPAIARAAGMATGAEVLEAARDGDRRAVDALERAGTMLGIGIANTVLAVGPDRVVVGGGVARAGELLLEPARRELVRRNRMMPVERIAVVQAELGSLAGPIGAALWASRNEAPQAPQP